MLQNYSNKVWNATSIFEKGIFKIGKFYELKLKYFENQVIYLTFSW